MRLKLLAMCGWLLGLAVVAEAQIGVRGQIFLPNGAPAQRQIRFTVTSDDGMRTEIYFTDSNGRIAIPRMTGPYKLTVETDGAAYGTTTVSFNPVHAGNYITIHLIPVAKAHAAPPGTVDANEIEQKISPKAREAYESATKLLAAGQYEQAIEPLKRAVALQPNYFRAYNELGVAYLKLNQLDQAAEAFRRAIKINDQDYRPRLNLGITLNRQGKSQEAAETLSKLRRDFPELEPVREPLIEALIGARLWAQAEEQIEQALGLKDVDTVDLQIKLGAVLLRQGKGDASVTALRKVVLSEPDNALAQFNLGAALFETAKLDEAEATLRRAYQIEGAKMPGAQLLLGQVYFQKNDYAKAIAAFEAYLRDLPDAPNAAQVKDGINKLRQALGK
jgi:Flp pilus assembly protein TadD